MYFLTELQTRPDGKVNSSITECSSQAKGLALYFQRAAAVVTSTEYITVALTLQDQYGNITENRLFETEYEEQ